MRQLSRVVAPELGDGPIPRALLRPKKRSGGRNVHGRITAYYRGGGAKKHFRVIDLKRTKLNVPGKVERIEKDPNRSAFIALIHYSDGDKRFILAPLGLSVGDTIYAGPGSPIKPGCTLPLREIPTGTPIHNVGLTPGRAGQIARTAGASAQVVALAEHYAHVRLPSGEIRLINLDCQATIGQLSNLDHENFVIGKAGRQRHMGRKPHNRGVVKNPVDHPHGGGEGKTSGGRHPCSPWGQLAKGYKTRRNRRTTGFIVTRRP